jgi:hypothetical protein
LFSKNQDIPFSTVILKCAIGANGANEAQMAQMLLKRQKCAGILPRNHIKIYRPPKKFFSKKSIFFYLLTYIQPPMAHLKITLWKFFFDRVSPLLASKGSKKHLLCHKSSF